MLKSEPVGWSSDFINKICSKCQTKDQIQFVQMQKKIKLGPIKIINIGERTFGRECLNCLDLTSLSKGDTKEVKKSSFYVKRQFDISSHNTRVGLSKLKKYPILSKETREVIRKDNIKEGRYSALIGTVIGILLFPWVSWAKWVIFLSWFGGLYAALEDPEMKHKATIEKTGSKFVKKKKGRSLT